MSKYDISKVSPRPIYEEDGELLEFALKMCVEDLDRDDDRPAI